MFEEFLDRIELTFYDNEYSDNKEDNDIHEAIYHDMIEMEGAYYMCRGKIDEGYIKEIFLDEEIIGFIAKVDGEYGGLIMFKRQDDELYLSLIATYPKLGLPHGQILMSVLEEVAEQSDIDTIVGDSIDSSLDFYIKNGWDILQVDNEDNTYFIEKQLKKAIEEVDFEGFCNFEDYSQQDEEEIKEVDILLAHVIHVFHIFCLFLRNLLWIR